MKIPGAGIVDPNAKTFAYSRAGFRRARLFTDQKLLLPIVRRKEKSLN
jgi:hypothetical protein